MNNVFDHSESKIPGYTFTQYNSSLNQIITCVCDFGLGIPNKINSYLKQNGEPTLDNMSALLKSFENKFSTKTKEHNKGFGWDLIFSNVIGLNSKMLIISNNCLFWQLNNCKNKVNVIKGNFPGTCVIIYLDTQYLPENEGEYSDELKIL